MILTETKLKKSGLIGGWHTSSSQYACRIAFNLWNGYMGDTPEDAKNYTPDSFFSREDAEFFLEGIKLRFPDTAPKKERYQIVNEQGSVVEEAISHIILAQGYVLVFEKQNGGSYKIEPMQDITMDV